MKIFSFSADDTLAVREAGPNDAGGNATESRWSLTPRQMVKHRTMFDADMSAAEKARVDAIAAKTPR
jgi:hypothetical protein